jgi:16S rRNA processing protein RimM
VTGPQQPTLEPVEGFVPIGRIVGTFGLRGAVKVVPMTGFPERFEEGKTVYLQGRPLKILRHAWHKTQVRIWLEGFKRIEEAQPIVGELLYVPEEDVPELEADEFLVRDLLGMEAYSEDGRFLGVVEEVLAAPAHDLYRIGGALVPAVKEFVVRVDLKQRRMVIRPIPGLFPDDED